VPGIVHRCYAGSASASALVTASSSLFRTSARHAGVTPIAISEAMGRWLTTAGGFAPGRIRVKHNGVAGPTGDVPPAVEQRTFLFLGRLAAYKGLALMLDAWRRADVDAELRIVGDGDLADDVAATAAGDGRITWIGQVAPERVGDEIAAARTVLVPSVWDEPFGRTAAEALAHGRPVITTGTGGLSEIVDDGCGWVTGTDPASLARALAQAASDDPGIERRAAAAGHRWSARFSPAATTAGLIEIYDAVRAGWPGPQRLPR
jgi:glycosyltransferase involved in cell wall biosynthesis